MEPSVLCVYIISSLWVVLVKSMHLLSSYLTRQSLRHVTVSHYDTLMVDLSSSPYNSVPFCFTKMYF